MILKLNLPGKDEIQGTLRKTWSRGKTEYMTENPLLRPKKIKEYNTKLDKRLSKGFKHVLHQFSE